MPPAPRIVAAIGLASLCGAVLLLTGRIDAPIVTILALALAAQASAVAGRGGAVASRGISSLLAAAPVWIAAATVATIRAGSVHLSDVRGANAVAGPAVAFGPPLLVAACGLAAIATLAAVASCVTGSRDPVPYARLEIGAIAVQAALVVTLFAGPEIGSPGDVLPWSLGAVAAALVLVAAHRIPRRVTVASMRVAAVMATALALVGGSL